MGENQHLDAGRIHGSDHVRSVRTGKVDGVEYAHVTVHVIDGARLASAVPPEGLSQWRRADHSCTSLRSRSRLPEAIACLSARLISACRIASIIPPGYCLGNP